MNARNPWPVLPIVAGLASGLLTGCGAESGDTGADGCDVVVGMSDDVLSTDPASWLLFSNVFQVAARLPQGSHRAAAGRRREYGPATDQELKAIAGQLDAGGLFDADVESVPFAQYEKDIAAGKYGVYAKGWVPDYPDADNFTGPFFGKGNVLDNNYDGGTITESLLPRTAARSDRSATDREFGRIQDVVAEGIPVLPLWQAKQYAVVQDGVYGPECCLDASTVFRFWELSEG